MNRCRSLLPAALVVALFISAAAAGSDSIRLATVIPCADPKTMGGMLQAHGEQQLGTAVAADNTPLVLRVNPQTRTFTVLVRRHDGMNCILAAGRDFKLTGKLISGLDL